MTSTTATTAATGGAATVPNLANAVPSVASGLIPAEPSGTGSGPKCLAVALGQLFAHMARREQQSRVLEVVMNESDSIRAQWVAAWEQSGLSQEAFAAQHGLSPRTLRSWRQKLGTTRQPPAEQVRGVVTQAIEALTAVLAALDAAACQPADPVEPEEYDEACHPAAEEQAEDDDVQAEPGMPTDGGDVEENVHEAPLEAAPEEQGPRPIPFSPYGMRGW